MLTVGLLWDSLEVGPPVDPLSHEFQFPKGIQVLLFFSVIHVLLILSGALGG